MDKFFEDVDVVSRIRSVGKGGILDVMVFIVIRFYELSCCSLGYDLSST